MMIPSTSTDIRPKNQEEQVECSDYEDAVDSEEELSKLCTTLKNHLINKTRVRNERKVLKQQKQQAAVTPRNVRYRSSSSDHSSIEKLQPGEMRSRRNTGGMMKKRVNNGGGSDSDHSDWRLLNHAFQEMAHYPLLVQLNERLIEIARQLNEIEATNSLQLKVIMHLLHRISKPRRTWFNTIIRFIKNFQFLIFAFSWPFIARILYYSYLRIVHRKI